MQSDSGPLPVRTRLPGGAAEGDPLARIVRPFWIVSWVSVTFAALLLVPTYLPVYGERLPASYWLGVVMQFAVSFILATRAWWYRREAATWWLAIAGAGLGIEVVYTVGAVALLTMTLDLSMSVMMALFGVACLGALVQLERWGVEALQSASSDTRILTS